MAKKNQKKAAAEKTVININEDTVFKRNDDNFLNTEVDGETVMMDTVSGTYWGMNTTTTLIWHMLETPLSFQQIISNLLKEFEVEEETCKKDTFQALANLVQIKILSVEN